MTHRLCMLSFFHGGYTSLFSQQRWIGIPRFHTLASIWVFSVFLILAILLLAYWYHIVILICIFWCLVMLSSFHLHIDHIDITFLKCLSGVFSNLNWKSVILLVYSSLYFLHVHTHHLYVLQLSSPNLWFTFSFL